MVGRNLGEEVCATETYIAHSPTNPKATVNVIDAGCKRNIVRLLKSANCKVRVVPITATQKEWTTDCDFLFLSNGPGDPASLTDAIEKIKTPAETDSWDLSWASTTFTSAPARTYKPLDIEASTIQFEMKILVESSFKSNHGFCVDRESLLATGAEVTHLNLNDDTIAGMRHKDLNNGCTVSPRSLPWSKRQCTLGH